MLKISNSIRALTAVVALLAFNPGTVNAMPKQATPAPAPPGASPLMPMGQPARSANTPPPPVNDLAAWLQWQVAARNSAATAQAPSNHAARAAAVAKLEGKAGGKVKIFFRRNGTPSEIKGPVLERQFAGALNAGATRRVETGRSFLRGNRDLLLLENPDEEWQLRNQERDAFGREHLRFRQEFKGLPVWPCELIVHLDANGNVDLVDGAFIPTPRGLGTRPTITAEQALQRARTEVARGISSDNPEPELIVYGPLDEPARLAWKFDLNVGMEAWRCIVDALDGSLLAKINLVNDGAVTGSGVDGLGMTRTLHLWQQGAPFYMVDTSKLMYDGTSTPPSPQTTRGAIFIWDTQNQPPTSNVTDMPTNSVQVTSASATSGWAADAVGASFGLSETYDYYLARHARNSIDGLGGSMNGFVRVGINWPNAQWVGSLKIMRFGDGLTRALDVCGHELTHGVINSVGDGGILNYHDQPGALNESFADIFGQNVEARTRGSTDWLVGAELTGSLSGPLRNMANPGALQWTVGAPYPSKMSQFYQLPQSTDVGGVHINSSIINHCYYLLAAGLTGAIDVTNAERIFYRAMTLHLAKESQFVDARYACITSAEEIFGAGSTQAQKTAEAFDAVEIVDAPTTPPPTPVPTVPAADSTLFLRYDPFFSQYSLYRREAARSDPVSGTFIPTVKYLAPERVSVSGDGSFVFFVTVDHDYGTVNTDGTSAQVANQPGSVHSLAMTPDGKKFAVVPLGPSGQPTNYVFLIDIASAKTTVVKLYDIDSEGNEFDVIKYADVLDFTSDGSKLVYDAYSETRTASNNVFSGWTMYSLDVASTNITALIHLDAHLDFGNPSLGKTRNNLVTFEAVNRQTGFSAVFTGDLFTGGIGLSGQAGAAGALGKPDYAGDDRAIVYAQYDFFAFSSYDLVGQGLAADGITTNGAPFLWVSDADYVSMYRRGTFVASNALPIVALTNPVNGQLFAPGANITLQASASDPGGSVAKVEFYRGSTKLGEKLTAPYNFTWTTVPAGKYRVSARAIDNLGGTTDSSQIAIVVANRPRLTNLFRLNPTTFQGALVGDAGLTYLVQQSSNLVNWSTLTTVSNGTGTVSFQDATVSGQPRRFYRALIQ